jgi:DNA cross-link repair 1A protein
MFRNPRRTSPSDPPLIPDIGRPPTPPSDNAYLRLSKNAAKSTRVMAFPSTPVLGRSKTTRMLGSAGGKTKDKGNGTILSFFQKAAVKERERNSKEESLFLDDDDFGMGSSVKVQGQTVTPPKDVESPTSEREGDESDKGRFNEVDGSVKRRKLDNEDGTLNKSPFFSESNLEGYEPDAVEAEPKGSTAAEPHSPAELVLPLETLEQRDRMTSASAARVSPTPTLKRETTSYGEINDFDGIEDFADDEFPEEGEEYMERRWMQEQAELELGLEEDDEPGGKNDFKQEDAGNDDQANSPEAPACPLCGVALVGITDQEASKHVNDCLDGKPTPLPKPVKADPSPPLKKESGVGSHKRFQRAAVARPGQENPFGLTQAGGKASSAFSTLMSGHAEDAAWATAAATETASRGKPAYQRTCPFYKILPGFSICVDAFRYGAVEGCKAYFLSHFHSDHYIGLTSSWCHGPIYCSHVTANLVRQQLRVDPKWVFGLDFDQKMEVPETGGVEVTMIPANHCPGSSLYLYEKVVGKGSNPKLQRVLHCGDFRACTAHVQHPLLRPDVIDAVTGKKTAQQKLDVCYLDTTYLTPKYAFPSQEDVIKSCADMCVSLSKDFVDTTDSWEQTKRERAGTGMVKFVRKDSDIKVEEPDEAPPTTTTDSPPTQKRRGRLLVIVGTYSIGKERICVGVAKALHSKIYAPPQKQRIAAALEDPELTSLMTSDPLEAQVHMQMLMEIRAETLADYLTGYKPHFSRIVGFRPSGWNYRPPNSRFTESPSVQTVLYSDNWKSRYSMKDLVPQRGSTREASCFGVPYSEHSSFRELTMFCCALRIERVIPTVNVGSAKSRERMKGWCEKWAVERRKNGLFRVEDGQRSW